MFVTHFPTEKTALMSTSLREEKKKGEKENEREEKNRLLALNTISVYNTRKRADTVANISILLHLRERKLELPHWML